MVEGSGEGTIDILWDDSEFTINPVFISLEGLAPVDATSEGENWKKVTLSVDSTEKNRYVVQFYKKKENTTYTGPKFPSIYIKCKNYQAATPTPGP